METVRQSTPSVLFIIGNGFDLGLGMKTSYRDIYESYLRKPSPSAVIEKFKADLSQCKPYDKWSDFEMGMAEYAQTLSSEEELIECVRDFKRNMFEHLETENEMIADKLLDSSNAKGIIYEWDNSLYSFYNSFAPNTVNEIKRALGTEYPKNNFITFNYTEAVEFILSAKQQVTKVHYELPLHIHGSLTKDVVLGVDNIKQLSNLPYSLSRKATRAFVKTLFNEEYDKSRVYSAQRMILDSTVICTYGFSWGKSDKTWVELIIRWLKEKSSHHLVVYQYDTARYDRLNFDEMMDAEDEKKEFFLNQIGINDESLLNQIHIPIGSDIFNFGFIEKKDILKNKISTSESLSVSI